MLVRRVVVFAGLIAGAVVVVAPEVAGASVATSSAGTTISVALSGTESIGFGCVAGKVVVNHGGGTATPSPAVNCSALTQVTVTGDSGNQGVDGSGLDGSAFTAKPKLVAALSTGLDELTETKQADTIDLGGGSDDLYLQSGSVANQLLEMGAGTIDDVTLVGTAGDDEITVASTGANATLALDTGSGPAKVWVVQNVEYVDVLGDDGDDVISATNVSSGSALANVRVDGEDGDDTITGGSRPLDASGGSGANTITLGTAADTVDTDSETDTIIGTLDGADDVVYDSDSLRFGGRTLTGFANGLPSDDVFQAGSQANDLTVRIRPGSGGSAIETMSLQRTGQQQIPAGFEVLRTSLSTMSPLDPRLLADVVLPAQDIEIGGTTSGKELIDITVPTGSWTDTVAAGRRTIATSSASVGSIELSDSSPYKVHGPWANQNQGFGHRVYRDLLLRFASNAERDLVRDQLANGTKTRAQVVAGIVGTDAYRGLDVDRVFMRYLLRATDPSGRTYWINAIRNGRSLRQFRAQLFGSNEYFNKAGGTNSAFVTKAYEDVLGRKPDPSGQAYWTNKANNGTDRGVIARQFLASNEAKRALVKDQFLRFLDRVPTATESSTWTAALDSSANGEQALVSFLAASNAYFTRS